MPQVATIEELRLEKFKSFHGAVLPLRDLTLLIGRNGSGKSNALDALEVLSKLAQGEDIREAIDGGRREGSAVRGGIEGCAPIGDAEFAIGCSVNTGEDVIHLDVTVQTEPHVQITAETLWRSDDRRLLYSDPPDPDSNDISARYYNGKRGLDPAIPFRASRLLTSQIATKVPTSSKACREVHSASEQVLEALDSVFVLDPVPALMRQYVPERDFPLRRRADNLSAAIQQLKNDPEAWERLIELVRSLPEQDVADVSVEASPLGDVMLAVREWLAGNEVTFPARLMSDGMLRFLAFAVALLEAPLLPTEAEGAGEDSLVGQTTLVIEEIENGLHPSQSASVVQLIKEESRRRRVRALATTHSPALLSALEASDHEGVVLCDREPETARSRLRRLVDLPDYPTAMASGPLGDAVTRRLLTGSTDGGSRQNALDRLLAQL